MLRNGGRRILYHPDHPAYASGYRDALAMAKSDLRDVHLQHIDQLEHLKVEVSELRNIVADVVHVLRQNAEADVFALRHELELALVRLCRRDSNEPLH
jgi:hypothetical protein